MKSSLTYTTAAALRGFAGWFSGPVDTAMPDVDHVPFVVSACGYHSRDIDADEEIGQRRDRWLPGLSLDNFS
jgi:hypothetical protein